MANEALKAIAAAVTNGDVSTIMTVEPEVFMNHADLAEFVKGYYMEHHIAPTQTVISDALGVILPEGSGATEHHLNAARDAFIKFRVGNLLLNINRGMDDVSSKEILDELQKASNGLRKYTAGAKDVNMTDSEGAEKYFDKLRNASDGDRPGIRTGFQRLDASYPTGLMPGQSLITIGYSGHGKSLWTAKLAVNVWRQKKRVLVFSLEMSPEEYRERVYALLAEGNNGISMSALATGQVGEQDFKDFANEHLLEADDFIVVSNEGRMDVTPGFIQSKIDMYKPDFVLLDYLQLMMDDSRSEGMTPRMMNLSREIKLMAMANNIPIMSISAVTDAEGKKRTGPPTVAQVAWSRALEYDANMIIAVHKHEDTDVIQVVSRKVRNGKPFDFILDVDFDRGIWTEKDSSELLM